MYKRILSIDDDENFLKSVKKFLEMKGFYVAPVSNSSHALEVIQNNYFDCVLLDVKMPGINGVDLLKISLQKHPNVPVIMVSGQSNISIAVEAIKNGAYDFIEKPVDPDRLFIAVKNAITKKNLIDEKENIYKELTENYKIVCESEALKKVINKINTVASTTAKVLIQGETGTGKELVAWAIHHNSDRRGKPYIKVNCAAIPSELLESELFGHSKGSFTGAHADRQGKFLAADGGTLFLDEIGDMDLHLQAKLLRVLEENEVDVIGKNVPQKINVRIITATNQNLKQKVAEGTFRADLFHRLNVINIWLPPLRERKEDILPLAYHFLREFNNTYNKKVRGFNKQLEGILLNHPWKGNVRELKNVIEKLVIFSTGEEVTFEDMKAAIDTDALIGTSKNDLFQSAEKSLKQAKAEFEKKYIFKILRENDWKLNAAASVLGIDRTNLYKKMKKLGIPKNGES